MTLRAELPIPCLSLFSSKRWRKEKEETQIIHLKRTQNAKPNDFPEAFAPTSFPSAISHLSPPQTNLHTTPFIRTSHYFSLISLDPSPGLFSHRTFFRTPPLSLSLPTPLFFAHLLPSSSSLLHSAPLLPPSFLPLNPHPPPPPQVQYREKCLLALQDFKEGGLPSYVSPKAERRGDGKEEEGDPDGLLLLPPSFLPSPRPAALKAPT